MAYHPREIRSPRASGGLLRLLVALAENPLTGAVLAPKTLRDAGIGALRDARIDDPLPPLHPVHAGPAASPASSPDEPSTEELLVPGPSTGRITVGRLRALLREGTLTPQELLGRTLTAAERLQSARPPLGAFRELAPEKVLRELAVQQMLGEPSAPLAAIPVAIKDEVDCVPYSTTVGTRFLGGSVAEEDAETVHRLRAAGAIVLGKTRMHEIGMGVTGINPHHGTPRNPWDPSRATGGSSSGSAAAVASGLVPLALGADGGGSIRIPAALCGIVGLKPTWGRVSERGGAPLCWSVAHLGPLAASARDAALGYRLLAGEDPGDPATSGQPPVHLHGFLHDAEGVRIGVYAPWFEDADPQVVDRCRSLLDRFVEAGAELVEVGLSDPALAHAAHLVTIVSEISAAHLPYRELHASDYGLDIRLVWSLVDRLHPDDYIQAQRVRWHVARELANRFRTIDLLATPTTACTAPLLPGPSGLATGLFDLELTHRLMRFATLANLTGLPAISIPAGFDDGGLPVGLQLVGRAWDEALLLRMARIAEEGAEERRPTLWAEPLP